MSRESSYTPEIGDAICDRLINMESLRSICLDPEMPTTKTVFNWADSNPDFFAKYARARYIQAHALENDMAEIEERVLSGELDAAAARAVLGSKQWRAAKLAPKVYGDKMEVEHTGRMTVVVKDYTGRADPDSPRVAPGND